MSMMNKPVGIIGTGSCVPDNVVTNFDLEKIVDTNDQWIRERTGIEERYSSLWCPRCQWCHPHQYQAWQKHGDSH